MDMGNHNKCEEPTLDMNEQIAMMIKRRYSFKKQHLNLSLCQHYWKQILLSKDFAHIIDIHLQHNHIDDESISTLVQLRLPDLKVISLKNNQLTDIGLLAIMSSLRQTLQTLDVGNNYISCEDPALLSLSMPCLKTLKVCNNMVSAENITTFLDFKDNYAALTRLSLEGNNIGSHGIKFLTKAYFPALQNLSVSKCNIGSQGLAHLWKGNWPLIKLYIENEHFSSDSFILLYSNNKWQRLQTLSIRHECPLSAIYYMLCKFSTDADVWTSIKNDDHKNSIKQLAAMLRK